MTTFQLENVPQQFAVLTLPLLSAGDESHAHQRNIFAQAHGDFTIDVFEHHSQQRQVMVATGKMKWKISDRPAPSYSCTNVINVSYKDPPIDGSATEVLLRRF
jgi:hypothetical protein